MLINSISHRAQKRVLGEGNSPSLCCAPAQGDGAGGTGRCCLVQPWQGGHGTSVPAGHRSPDSSGAAGAYCNSVDWKLRCFVQQTAQRDRTCAMGVHATCVNALTCSECAYVPWMRLRAVHALTYRECAYVQWMCLCAVHALRYSHDSWSLQLPQAMAVADVGCSRFGQCAVPMALLFGLFPPSALCRNWAAVVLLLCLLFCPSFFEWGWGDCTFWWLLVISCQIFSLENIVLKLSHTALCWNGNCTCWKSHATQSFKVRNGVICNVVILIV